MKTRVIAATATAAATTTTAVTQFIFQFPSTSDLTTESNVDTQADKHLQQGLVRCGCASTISDHLHDDPRFKKLNAFLKQHPALRDELGDVLAERTLFAPIDSVFDYYLEKQLNNTGPFLKEGFTFKQVILHSHKPS